VISPDSSVVIAAFASWHALHKVAVGALGERPRLVAQCALETYSVLTRLPFPHRATPSLVRSFLEARFPSSYLALDTDAFKAWLERLPELGVSGGSAYDALIAATAHEHGATLVSLDQRAASIYERCGARVTILA
jgi:predicted nucleic acid-binding protein